MADNCTCWDDRAFGSERFRTQDISRIT